MPYTLFGIATELLLLGRFQVVDAVCEIHRPTIAGILKRFPVPASASTMGHVVLGRNREMLGFTRTHERVQVRQYERWGIMSVPAYLLASAVIYLQGKDAYRENPFEQKAYSVDDVDSSGTDSC